MLLNPRQVRHGAIWLLAFVVLSGTAMAAETVPGLNIPVHTFRPETEAPAVAGRPGALQAPATSPGAVRPGLGPVGAGAVKQMNALDQEKRARSAAQNKIDSSILHTLRMLQGKPVAEGIPA